MAGRWNFLWGWSIFRNYISFRECKNPWLEPFPHSRRGEHWGVGVGWLVLEPDGPLMISYDQSIESLVVGFLVHSILISSLNFGRLGLLGSQPFQKRDALNFVDLRSKEMFPLNNFVPISSLVVKTHQKNHLRKHLPEVPFLFLGEKFRDSSSQKSQQEPPAVKNRRWVALQVKGYGFIACEAFPDQDVYFLFWRVNCHKAGGRVYPVSGWKGWVFWGIRLESKSVVFFLDSAVFFFSPLSVKHQKGDPEKKHKKTEKMIFVDLCIVFWGSACLFSFFCFSLGIFAS